MDNEKIAPDNVPQQHADANYKRVEQEDYVLMVQDTTEIGLTRPHQQVTGAGSMDFETPRGGLFHPMVAFRCAVIFEPSEWKSVYATLGIKFSGTVCPTMNEGVRAIGRLGGFMDRPKNGARYPKLFESDCSVVTICPTHGICLSPTQKKKVSTA